MNETERRARELVAEAMHRPYVWLGANGLTGAIRFTSKEDDRPFNVCDGTAGDCISKEEAIAALIG